MRVLIALHLHQHLLSVFGILAILIGVQWNLIEFKFAFPLQHIRGDILSYAYMSSMYLQVEMSSKVIGSFFQVDYFLLSSFKSSQYILGYSPLTDAPFESIFSQSVSLLQIFFTVYFTDQKFLILMKSRLLFLFWIFPLVLYQKSNHHTWATQIFLLFTFQKFYSLNFTFLFVIHFQLIFVMGVTSVSKFIYLFFVHGCLLGLIPFVHQLLLHCLVYCTFIVSLEIEQCLSSNFILPQYYVDYSESFFFPSKH